MGCGKCLVVEGIEEKSRRRSVGEDLSSSERMKDEQRVGEDDRLKTNSSVDEAFGNKLTCN